MLAVAGARLQPGRGRVLLEQRLPALVVDRPPSTPWRATLGHASFAAVVMVLFLAAMAGSTVLAWHAASSARDAAHGWVASAQMTHTQQLLEDEVALLVAAGATAPQALREAASSSPAAQVQGARVWVWSGERCRLLQARSAESAGGGAQVQARDGRLTSGVCLAH